MINRREHGSTSSLADGRTKAASIGVKLFDPGFAQDIDHRLVAAVRRVNHQIDQLRMIEPNRAPRRCNHTAIETVIAQQSGADSASVIFDALQAATARGIDVLIADTAGRLHTKANLMEELAKIARVMKKIDPEAPHEVLLVVDATTGQNAIAQAQQFNASVPLTGIALTKLDGTAKGGVLFAIAERLRVPIRFIGVGESIDDLRPFVAEEFLEAIFGS